MADESGSDAGTPSMPIIGPRGVSAISSRSTSTTLTADVALPPLLTASTALV